MWKLLAALHNCGQGDELKPWTNMQFPTLVLPPKKEGDKLAHKTSNLCTSNVISVAKCKMLLQACVMVVMQPCIYHSSEAG